MTWFWTLCEDVITVFCYIGTYLNCTLREVVVSNSIGSFTNPLTGQVFNVFGFNKLVDIPILGDVVDFASNVLFDLIDLMFPFASIFPMWLTLLLVGACIIVPIVIWNTIVG